MAFQGFTRAVMSRHSFMQSSRSVGAFDTYDLRRYTDSQQRLLAAKAALSASKVRVHVLLLVCHGAHTLCLPAAMRDS